MMAGTEPATCQGPVTEVAVNQVPFWQAYQECALTRIIGVEEFTT